MTVKELIEELKKYNENQEVAVEVHTLYDDGDGGDVEIEIEEVYKVTLDNDKIILHYI